MDRQEIFNQVRNHLIAQGARSVGDERRTDGDLVCQYRGRGGLKCAIGCLIPDEAYDIGMEGMRPSSLCSQYPAVRAALGLMYGEKVYWLDVSLLTELQEVHDDHPPERWPEQMRRVAFKWNLAP